MNVENTILEIRTEGENDIIDLTLQIEQFVKSSQITDGILNVSVPGSTGAIITTEFERGLIEDNKKMINELIPKGMGYLHDKIDNNAHSHLRASILGSEKTFSVIDNEIMIGIWQQIVFFECDVHPRSRRVVLQLLGVKK
ncbi:MAG: YjbQ family protein [Candidatus Heimdallarchaeota archaeon]|nr:YjbQ family protein [Candidatus Heimdallarchaeota archaeon]